METKNSDKIRQAQTKEIDLLIEHYLRLLQADGNDYISLVVNAYQNRQNYIALLEQLETAEKKVTEAARLTLGDQTDTAALASLEESAFRARRAEVERLFGS